MIKKEYTFDNFIVDRSNEFAFGVCKKSAKTPFDFFNMIWLFGPSGCGKSHLLKAVYNSIEIQGGPDVCFTDAKTVVEALFDHIGADSYRWNKLQKCDVLIIDNMDFISGRTATQKEILRLFETKCKKGNLVMVASTAPPKFVFSPDTLLNIDVQDFLIADIESPSYALRKTVAEQYLKKHPLPITKGALKCACESNLSIAQIYGFFNSAKFWSRTNGKKVTLTWARKYIDNLGEQSNGK